MVGGTKSVIDSHVELVIRICLARTDHIVVGLRAAYRRQGKEIHHSLSYGVDPVSRDHTRVGRINQCAGSGACGCIRIVEIDVESGEISVALRLRGHGADIRYALVVAGPLVIAKEESAILDDGTADKASELVALERWLPGGSKKICRIQRTIAEI